MLHFRPVLCILLSHPLTDIKTKIALQIVELFKFLLMNFA